MVVWIQLAALEQGQMVGALHRRHHHRLGLVTQFYRT